MALERGYLILRTTTKKIVLLKAKKIFIWPETANNSVKNGFKREA
jgi:hypothetical protein